MESIIEAIIGLIALSVMEIVLGIDNIVFIAILTDKLPEEQRPKARRLGLAAALIMRLALLCSLKAILGFTEPLFELTQLGIPESFVHDEHWLNAEVNAVSLRDLILFGGGLFLIKSSIREIHHKLNKESEADSESKAASFRGVLIQIAVMDIIFSLDSVITAVGMVDDLTVMIISVIIAVGVMLIFSDRISEFIRRQPTIKMLALSFLLLIGVMLVAEGIGTHIEKGYIYFAMAFSLIVEALNIRSSGQAKSAAA